MSHTLRILSGEAPEDRVFQRFTKKKKPGGPFGMMRKYGVRLLGLDAVQFRRVRPDGCREGDNMNTVCPSLRKNCCLDPTLAGPQ